MSTKSLKFEQSELCGLLLDKRKQKGQKGPVKDRVTPLFHYMNSVCNLGLREQRRSVDMFARTGGVII